MQFYVVIPSRLVLYSNKYPASFSQKDIILIQKRITLISLVCIIYILKFLVSSQIKTSCFHYILELCFRYGSVVQLKKKKQRTRVSLYKVIVVQRQSSEENFLKMNLNLYRIQENNIKKMALRNKPQVPFKSFHHNVQLHRNLAPPFSTSPGPFCSSSS